MTLKLRPSRRGNFDKTGARLAELGIRFSGYDHRTSCYVGIKIPSGVEQVVRADPLIDVEDDAAPKPIRSGPVWGRSSPALDLGEIGARLRQLRELAGLDLAAAATLVGEVSAEAIDRIERTGQCEARTLILLADIYAASLDQIAGRTVIRGSRRRDRG